MEDGKAALAERRDTLRERGPRHVVLDIVPPAADRPKGVQRVVRLEPAPSDLRIKEPV